MMRCVIVDDEPLARRRLRTLLGAHHDIEVADECEDANAAVTSILTLRPELVFLDIELPGADGFAVMDVVRGTNVFIVFVTAYAEHAVRAFDADAVDYLLKPFDAARLARSLSRVRSALAERRTARLVAELRTVADHASTFTPPGSARAPLDPPPPASTPAPPWPARFAVTLGQRTLFVHVADIDWVEASGNYVRLHVGNRAHLLRLGLGALEAQLDPAVFARVHRSALVRLDRVRELRVDSRGDWHAVLADGTAVPVSERHRKRLREQAR